MRLEIFVAEAAQGQMLPEFEPRTLQSDAMCHSNLQSILLFYCKIIYGDYLLKHVLKAGMELLRQNSDVSGNST